MTLSCRIPQLTLFHEKSYSDFYPKEAALLEITSAADAPSL
jgi:hypothetical protein